MMHSIARTATLLLIIGSVGSRASIRPAAAADTQSPPLSETIHVLDAGGHVHVLAPAARESARAFVFLSGECPISRSYIPELNRLAAEWSKSGTVVLFGVWADRTTRPAEIRAFVDEYEVAFPILLDRGGELAALFQPTHLPEAVVLDKDGRTVYRGRIDNTWPALGQRKLAATENNLADAVADVVARRPVRIPQTASVGCPYESLPATAGTDGQLTFNRDIAPIVFANCVQCHRNGEVGPFPLTTYEDVAKRSQLIAHVTDTRLMPPWMPAETHGEFLGQRTLTAGQIAAFQAWSAADCPEGKPEDLPPLPEVTTGWRLGPPDLVLTMAEDFELGAEGPDLFQNFVIPIDVPEDKLVAAVDFVPGNPRIVHHSLLFLDASKAARKLDARTPEPGYSSFGGPGFLPSGSIGGWSPGKTPMRLPDGLGRYLRQGSDLVMQIHYHRSGKAEKDRSKVAVYFADKGGNIAADVWAASHAHDIPPGERDYRLSAKYVVPQDMQLLGVVPHMHLIGRSVKTIARFPDGTTKPIIEIPHWNFNWQDDYRFAQPLHLPAGTRLEVEAVYDNSEGNPVNPNSPPARVTWGEQTTNEMLYCFFLINVEDPRDLRPILTDMVRTEAISAGTARLRAIIGGQQ